MSYAATHDAAHLNFALVQSVSRANIDKILVEIYPLCLKNEILC